jgi:protein-disulfide isomerase
VRIAALVDNKPVYMGDIDKSVKQELYDELYRIYIIRKTAINETFKEYMLDTEAKKSGKSKNEYIEAYYKRKTNDSSLSVFIKKVNMDAVPELKRTLRYHSIYSPEGKALVLNNFKNYLLGKLIDSLRTVYKPKILIEPPLPPEITINNISAHYRGNFESKVTLLEVSDMECDKCREYYPVYENIYHKYKNKIRFGFTHFSTYVTLCALATECASKQGKFWEMHDSIMKRTTLPDTSDVFRLAEKLRMNMERFSKDFFAPEISNRIEYNFELLKNYGLFGTPTILINGKPVFNSSSESDIEDAINKELSSSRWLSSSCCH